MDNYDDLLRQTVDTYEATRARTTKTIADLEQQIKAATEAAEAARMRYYSQLAELARRRLAGEFQDVEEQDGDTDARVEEACRTLDNPHDFVASEISARLLTLQRPLNRSTLNGSLSRLVDRGVLRVIEQGYKRRPTRYAVVETNDVQIDHGKGVAV